MTRFTDHYALGTRHASKLPHPWREYPTIYGQQIRDKARKYADKWQETHECAFPEDPANEYHSGLIDACYKLAEDGKKYAVFEWTATSKYPAESAVSPLFDSESKARRWLVEHLTCEQHFHGGREERGHCVRSCYVNATEGGAE